MPIFKILKYEILYFCSVDFKAIDLTTLLLGL